MAIKTIKRHTDDADIDVTAFMNLMIVLVPVLLLSMTFTQITVMDITLPELTGGSSASAEAQSQLEVEINADSFKVYYPTNVMIQNIPNKQTDEGLEHDYRQLSLVLQEVKKQLDDKTDILLLSRPEVSYQTLVLTMDSVKSYKTVVAANLVEVELFPDISLGDAGKWLLSTDLMLGTSILTDKRPSGPPVKLSLVALMDIFTILVFFLLLNSGESQTLEDAKFVRLPDSSAETSPHSELVIHVGQDEIWMDNQIVELTSLVDTSGEQPIESLAESLQRFTKIHGDLNEHEEEHGLSVTIMADKDVPYAILKAVMATCSGQDFRDISLAVNRVSAQVFGGESAPAAPATGDASAAVEVTNWWTAPTPTPKPHRNLSNCKS